MNNIFEKIEVFLVGVVLLITLATPVILPYMILDSLNTQNKYEAEITQMQCKETMIKIDGNWQKVVSCERKGQ
ncbi:TPA: hypothetical protein QHB43_001687 [Aeromonas hydrophila subsp. hydrophila]|nr:hypothetical protein [Aeromonas hydrophila subsp. hydrophila]